MSKFLRIGVHIDTELCQDSEPDIVGADDQVVMLIVCQNGSLYEAVA